MSKCSSCGKEFFVRGWCGNCGYSQKDITIPPSSVLQLHTHWKYTDVHGKEHDVVAIEINHKIFHFGKGGLKRGGMSV